jgi:hypothetical protein
MIMLISWLIAMVCGLLPDSYPVVQNCDSMQGQTRVLSNYDSGGTYVINFNENDRKARLALADVRAFIWKHWYQRQMAKLTVTFYSKEGIPNTTCLYIEPDEHDHWRIVALRIDSPQADSGGNSLPASKETHYDIVRRIQLLRSPGNRTKYVPENEPRSPTQYALQLTNRLTGEQITI